MGQQLSVRTRSTISVASTALPKSRSLSMQNCLASPCLPSSISCWYFVSFIFFFICVLLSLVDYWRALCLLPDDRDSGLLADLWRIDFHPVAGLDDFERVLVKFVHGGNFTGYGAVDVDPVDCLADEACGAVVGHLALVV